MDFQLPRAIEILERTPATFRALLGGLPDEWTRPNEGPETFSAFDDLGHLDHRRRAPARRRACAPDVCDGRRGAISGMIFSAMHPRERWRRLR